MNAPSMANARPAVRAARAGAVLLVLLLGGAHACGGNAPPQVPDGRSGHYFGPICIAGGSCFDLALDLSRGYLRDGQGHALPLPAGPLQFDVYAGTALLDDSDALEMHLDIGCRIVVLQAWKPGKLAGTGSGCGVTSTIDLARAADGKSLPPEKA